MKKFALVVVAGLATACGVNTNNSTVKSADFPVHRSIAGTNAKILFAALEDAGVKPETVDGRIIIGAVTLSAGTLNCRVVMNAIQDASCRVEKDGEYLDVARASLAKRAAEVLEAAKAQTPHALYGVNIYEATDISCTQGVGPFALTRCEFNVSKDSSDDNASISKEISGDQAETLYKALESANVQAETVDGRVIIGAVTLKADELKCSKSFDGNFTKNCELSKRGERLGEIDSSLLEGLVDLLEDHGAQVSPRLTGANHYAIGEISCQMTVLARPEFNCSFELMH